jgi:predicted outer membrane repeat protein
MSNNGVADSAIDNSGTLVVRRSQFFSNVVDGDGSGAVLRNDGGDATFEDSLIAGNTIVLGNGTGGAIAVVNGNLTLDGCNVSNNSAHDGGALYIAPTAGTVRIVGSVFDNNLAGYGAAIESWGSEVSIVHGRFTNGDATTGDGGAIWELSGAITVDFSTFDDNAATTTGGAISCYDGSITIGRSTLSRNYAETTGGGVYATCAFSAHDVTFTGNGAIVGGGAVYLATAVDSSITHATIDANSAPFGAGLYNDGASAGTLHVASSIVSSNEGGSCDGVLASDGWNLNDDTSCGGVFTATGDLMGVATPLKLLGDYGGPTHTQPPADGNPAIDRIALGDAACDPPTDQRGTPRPYGVACDVGAIEVRDSLFAGDFEP